MKYKFSKFQIILLLIFAFKLFFSEVVNAQTIEFSDLETTPNSGDIWIDCSKRGACAPTLNVKISIDRPKKDNSGNLYNYSNYRVYYVGMDDTGIWDYSWFT